MGRLKFRINTFAVFNTIQFILSNSLVQTLKMKTFLTVSSVAVILLGLTFVDSQAVTTLNCEFVNSNVSRYTCRISGVSIPDDENIEVVIAGRHQANFTDKDVEGIELFSSNIPFIVPQLFTTFPNVHHMIINRGGLVRIQPKAFFSAFNLQTLIIMNEQLSTLDEFAFNGAFGLEILDIWQCQLQNISENTFENLPSLRLVHLERNQLSELPKNVFAPISNLETVLISRNNLSSLPNELFANNQRLTRVGVSNNRISSIGRNFLDNMKSLRRFDANGNVCVDDAWIVDDVNVTVGNIRDGLSECFANTVEDPINLQCRFEYSVANEYTCKLYGVEVLNESRKIVISGEHLDGKTDDDVELLYIENSNTPFMIQQLFTAFPNIDQLRIRGSKLESINVPSFIQLRVLILQGNKIPRIENKMFAGQHKLDELKLEFNNIQVIDEDAFEGHETIRGLDFIGNQISELAPKTFHQLKNLVYLDFTQNSLTRIDGELLSQNSNLYALSLNFNKINEISPQFSEAFKDNLKHLFLKSNLCIDQNFEDIEEETWEEIEEKLQNCFENFGASS